MIRKMLCMTALLALPAASPAMAQQQVMVDITGYGGLYLAVTDWDFSEEIAQAGGFTTATAGQAAAVLFGGRLTVWATDVFGVEGGFAFALSDVELEATAPGEGVQDICDEVIDGEVFPCDANVWLASLKALYRFMPQPGGIIAIHIGGGVAVIGRTGDAFEDTDGKTDIGGVLNIGATFDVTPQVAIRLDAEDYIYSAKFEDAETGEALGDSQFQNDLVITGGIVIKLGR